MLTQDRDVGHHAVVANYTWKIFYRWKELNLIIERHDFVVIGASLPAIRLDFLCPCNQHAKVGGLAEFGNFGCLRRTEQLGFHSRRRPQNSSIETNNFRP